MNSERTANERKQNYIAAMGSSTGELYYALDNEVMHLHAAWLEYNKLFGKDEKRIDFLNSMAGFFFRIVQDTLWDDVLLNIARLSDPRQTGNKHNLTLLQLPDSLSDPLKNEVQKKIDAAGPKWLFARDHRNRRVAHRDLKLALNQSAQPLTMTSRAMIDDALHEMAAIMNLVYINYFPKHFMGYEYFMASGNADDLVTKLIVADRAIKAKYDRLMRGEMIPEDHDPLRMP